MEIASKDILKNTSKVRQTVNKKAVTKDNLSDDRVKKPSDVVRYWLDKISKAKKRESTYRTDAMRVVEIYEQGKTKDEGLISFNSLYANTETLSPSVYNSLPRPEVRHRFRDKSPVAQAVAEILQKTLAFLINSNDTNYATFDSLQKSAVLEALIPGRGLSRFRYEYTSDITPAVEATEETPAVEASEILQAETVCGEQVPWDRICFGYAKNWQKLPWLAFEHFMTREEVKKNFSEEVADKIRLTAEALESEDSGAKQTPQNAEGEKFAHVYEIWDKTSRKIYFISEGYSETIKEEEDPLKLSGFFPIPMPLTFLPKVSSLVPQILYSMYESQAKELNDVTTRIGKLTRALKVRGFYDSTLSGLDTLLSKDDNTLIPAPNVAAMQQGQTLDRAIWLMPIDKIVQALQQLYINRTQIQSVIQQLTGIADIMRGASQASETLGAQEIKQTWGTLRLKRMQKEVQRFICESLRLMAEIAATNFSQETFAKITGVKLLTAQDKQMLQARIQAQQQQQAQQAQQQALLAQQSGQPPQPPQPPPPVPQEILAQLQKPTWEEVMALLQNDMLRNYSIDIETNSTIDAEATADKADVAEFMNAMAQFMNGLMPLVEKGILPFEVAKTMMLNVTRRFRFGVEIEEQLSAMTAPKPAEQKPDPTVELNAQKLQMELRKMQQDQQVAKEKQQMEMQLAQSAAEVTSAKNQAELEKIQLQSQLTREKFQLEREKLRLSQQTALAQLQSAQASAAVATARANAPQTPQTKQKPGV